MNNPIPKKLAIIEDICGVGRCSLSVSIPIISACAVQACPIPTAIFSNHTGYEYFYKSYNNATLADFFHTYAKQSITFDGVYCGYFGDVSQMSAIHTYLSNSKSLSVFIDPVMGDHGKMYKALPSDYLDAMKQFIVGANIITPNLTEACLLADVPYPTVITEDLLYALASKLSDFHINSIVITGIQRENKIGNYIFEKETNTHKLIEYPFLYQSRPGTGDIFASILFAKILNGTSLETALRIACDFINRCTKASDEAFVPIQEGVIFEPLLYHLYSN